MPSCIKVPVFPNSQCCIDPYTLLGNRHNIDSTTLISTTLTPNEDGTTHSLHEVYEENEKV